ncbi:MAG: class I SAM-dependent methyltransferase [Dehalococcoidia bacterium]|nr:class I SAM-dependent methyltransferase [Dehalococcoidia bacterium]
MTPLERLAADYPVWWVELLGEHNHAGGLEAARWLLDRSRRASGDAMLDCGAFVGAAARLAADRVGARAVASDLVSDFLAAGRALSGGTRVAWVVADTRRLPFADGSFRSVWALETTTVPAELSRVATQRATVCLCSEAPADGRGGLEAFVAEWERFGWSLAAHRDLTLEALQSWRAAEAALVRGRSRFESRYGARAYLAQLDQVASLVHDYERRTRGHGLFVLAR